MAGVWALCSLIAVTVGGHLVLATDSCQHLLDEYRTFMSDKQAAPYTGDNMLFFLHIPRTAGGTLNCLMRAAVPPAKRCRAAYKRLPEGVLLSNCSLLGSHDDYSAMQQLPKGTAVVTELRDPVDRFLSAYEFSIEQAAKRFNRTRDMVAAHLSEAIAYALTDDVWPWNYLVPFFVKDATTKMKALRATPLKAPGVWTIQRNPDGTRFYFNKFTNTSKASLTKAEQQLLVPELDAYDNDIALPLKEFVHHTAAMDLLHNGQTLQVLGLTNYSYWQHAAELRACMFNNADIAEALLQEAIQRLDTFAHVGATAQLSDSVEVLVSSLGWSFDGKTHPYTDAELLDILSGVNSPDALKQEMLKNYRQHAAAAGEQPLGLEFHRCALAGRTDGRTSRARTLRRLRLNDWRQLYFDKEDRISLQAGVTDEIRRMNALDMRLYEHAVDLLAQRRQQLKASGKLQVLPPLPPELEEQKRKAQQRPDKATIQKVLAQQVQKYLSSKSTSEL